MSSQLPETLKGREKGKKMANGHTTARPGADGRPGRGWVAGRTHHCRMLESMGLEKIGGEVLATVGLGSNPSISRKKCALGGQPSEAIRAGVGPVCPDTLLPRVPTSPECSHSGHSVLDSVPACPRLALTAALWRGCCPYHPHFTGGHAEALRSSNWPEVTQQVGVESGFKAGSR